MTTFQLIIVCVTVLALASERRRAADARLLVDAHRIDLERGQLAAATGVDVVPPRSVTVITRQPDDQTIHGLLVEESPSEVRLAQARYVTAAGEVPFPGDGRIYKINISLIQDHGEA